MEAHVESCGSSPCDADLHIASRDFLLREQRLRNEAYREAVGDVAGEIYGAVYTQVYRDALAVYRSEWKDAVPTAVSYVTNVDSSV